MITQTSGKIVSEKTLFYKKHSPSAKSLTQIDKDEYDQIAINLDSKEQERLKNEKLETKLIVQNELA